MRLRSVLTTVKVLASTVLVFVVAALLILSYAPHLARRNLEALEKLSDVGSGFLAPPLMANRETTNCVWMNQNWSDADRAWFHNVSQGTATFPVPYVWFKNLERPEISPFGPIWARDVISDPQYLERLGFIAPNEKCDPKAGTTAPEGAGVLPVGFAVLKGGLDPASGKQAEDGLGLTCAACHTGRIFYKGTELRIDGAPAMIDIQNLERIIGLSICYPDYMPWRKRRLATKILEGRPDLKGTARAEEYERIQAQISAICQQRVFAKIRTEAALLERTKRVHSEEGFGRLDALNRIGNQVFHENLLDPENPSKPKIAEVDGGLSVAALDANFAAHNAPVSFPPIWGVPHFTWAQYDASIFNPGIRNIGEAMGVSARINMTDPSNASSALFSSTVDVDAIARVENLLSGEGSPFDEPVGFKGLTAPKWAEAAAQFPGDDNWKIETEAIVAGRGLYSELCVECHRSPPQDEILNQTSFWSKDENWMRVKNEWLLDVVQKPVDVMGTDPEQARVLTQRTVNIPKYLGLETGKLLTDCEMQPDGTLQKSFVIGLMTAVERVREQWIIDKERLDGHAMSDADKSSIRGSRPNCPNPQVFQLMQPVPQGGIDQTGSDPKNAFYVARPQYRARPLDGIWATAPYLHNGSVPTLDDLLSPQDNRPMAFCVGPLEFDTVRVGLPVTSADAEAVQCPQGITRFNATKRGNSNRGHAFEGTGTQMPLGVIGRELSAEERKNLIAYLKTL